MRPFALALVVLLLTPLAPAQAPQGPDVVVQVPADGAPLVAGDADMTLARHEPGENLSWTLRLSRNYTTIEFRIAERAFDVERPRQVVPHLHLDASEPHCASAPGACEYTLFEMVPRTAVWDVDGPARIANVTTEAGAIVLRIGVPGPVNATLSLVRDVRAPGFTLGNVTNVTHIGFLQTTTTDELAIADLQVREKGASEWVQNPTAVYHVLQRFPIQGLDADTEHEARVVFTDWAGNVATSETYTVRSAPLPDVSPPVITPLEPAPNATLNATDVVIRARIETAEPLAEGGIRLFFDLREVTSNLVYLDGVLSYTPRDALAPGPHRVSVEAMNAQGIRGDARWSFTVAGATATEANEAPLPAALALLALAAAGTMLASRRR